jgi:hypothetical protein
MFDPNENYQKFMHCHLKIMVALGNCVRWFIWVLGILITNVFNSILGFYLVKVFLQLVIKYIYSCLNISQFVF